MTVWGLHMGRHVGMRPIEEKYVAIGWKEMGDIRGYTDVEAYNVKLKTLDNIRPGAIPVYSSLLNRYVHEIKIGDIVIYPCKSDRRVYIGEFTGKSEYNENDPDGYPNKRMVSWLGDFPRDEFPQFALNEISSALTLFKVKRNQNIFLAKINRTFDNSYNTQKISDLEDALVVDEDVATISVAAQAEETTTDFIIRRLMITLKPYEFEDFIAHLLECMGYKSRVTQRSGDGGVDIIAHLDTLGFQPPIIKVQCKRSTASNGEPEVHQLLGTLRQGEYGLFINLGSYSRPARLLERNDPRVRLIDGYELTQLITDHYSNFAPRYRSIIPLKIIHVPDLKEI